MPYVEGFGTWPFGEEWLWEAIATSYVPLLDVLGQAPITLSLTPVLCDQLEDAEAMSRCMEFLETIRPESHRLDVESFRARGQDGLADELERSAADYEAATTALAALPDGLLAALGGHASWTSSATHAVLPLLASDTAIAVQVQTGTASHRRRFGDWEGGFWLPECGYAPWLGTLLEQAGVRSACVELTNHFGLGHDRHLRPLQTPDGPVLWPVDRETIARVWGATGYPSGAAYRNYHHFTEHRHRAHAIDGAPYDREAAARQIVRDAEEFVGCVSQRVRDGGVCVCALDTELLGHWWYEGVRWLQAVIDQSARQGLKLTTLDDALKRHQPEPAPPDLGVTSWGAGGDLRTWSGPAVAEMACRARTLELKLLAQGTKPNDRALRELLALQASDWAFIATNELAGEYPRQRATAHAEALERAMATGSEDRPALRNLAPDLAGWEG
jgi:1,4-alpha-glucan branching enzyme